MKRVKTFALGFLFLLLPFFFLSAAHAQDIPKDDILEGNVTQVHSEERTDSDGKSYVYQTLSIDVTKGSMLGKTIYVVNDTSFVTSAPVYAVGDRVVVLHTVDVEGQDIFYVTDYVRREGLVLLCIAFAILAILVGGKWGASSLVGMAFSFFIIFQFVLPQIMSGKNAVLIAILGSAMIIPVTFSLSHGLKTKTWIACLGTVVTLIIIGLLAVFAVNATHLAGFGSEEAAFLEVQFGHVINMKGLLLAGIIIASLGILDDITISQASIVSELRDANKSYAFADLYKRAMNVGRDHIASLINTLVLVYAGASLPLLLLFVNNPSPFSDVVNHEMIAEEIVRILVGSMGLILAVPITTLLAAYYYRNK